MPNVLKISEAASLAMHTMGLLAAKTDRMLSTKEIASVLGASEAHLSKVLQRLSRGGFVMSIRGPKGGFTLGRESDEIFLLEVYESIEGPLISSNCLLGEPVCDGTECILGGLLKTVNKEVKEYLSETKVSDLIGAYKNVDLA